MGALTSSRTAWLCLRPPPSPRCHCQRGCDRLHPAVPLSSPAFQFADLTFPRNAGLGYPPLPHLISEGLSLRCFSS